jgi:hypothetical protein
MGFDFVIDALFVHPPSRYRPDMTVVSCFEVPLFLELTAIPDYDHMSIISIST